MKLMLRPEWRLWPLSSFLGLLDLKTGVTIALLFALLNKVAGVYGLIAVLTGAGGSFAQISLYIYSVLTLVALVWGLKAIKEEDPKHSLYFAHIFFADHIFSTAWTVFFAVVWWWYTPHDGRRQANSEAQEELIRLGSAMSGARNMTDTERAEAAMMIWNKEKGMAATFIIISWLTKLYFAALLYSYASHLRKGSYRSLPLSRPNAQALNTTSYEPLAAEEDGEVEEFYRLAESRRSHGSSLPGFADFVGTPRQGKARNPHSSTHPNGNGFPARANNPSSADVLFDEDDSKQVPLDDVNVDDGLQEPDTHSRARSRTGSQTS